MPYKKSGILMHIAIGILIACSIVPLFAQDDPDPNSPAPVLIGISGTNRAAIAS